MACSSCGIALISDTMAAPRTSVTAQNSISCHGMINAQANMFSAGELPVALLIQSLPDPKPAHIDVNIETWKRTPLINCARLESIDRIAPSLGLWHGGPDEAPAKSDRRETLNASHASPSMCSLRRYKASTRIRPLGNSEAICTLLTRLSDAFTVIVCR